MSYSEHFRRKILAKLEEGYSIRAVATQFELIKIPLLNGRNV